MLVSDFFLSKRLVGRVRNRQLLIKRLQKGGLRARVGSRRRCSSCWQSAALEDGTVTVRHAAQPHLTTSQTRLTNSECLESAPSPLPSADSAARGSCSSTRSSREATLRIRLDRSGTATRRRSKCCGSTGLRTWRPRTDADCTGGPLAMKRRRCGMRYVQPVAPHSSRDTDVGATPCNRPFSRPRRTCT